MGQIQNKTVQQKFRRANKQRQHKTFQLDKQVQLKRKTRKKVRTKRKRIKEEMQLL